jgi:hypothetical protein
MIYLFVYLAVGALTLMGMLIDARLRRSRTTTDWRKISALARRARQPWQEAILERLIVPLVAGAVVIIAWPIAIAFAVHFYHQRGKDVDITAAFEPDQLRVKLSDLVARLSIQEIERMETVSDPLLAVPSLPFGHLNRAWLDFAHKIQSEDDIWSFQAHCGSYPSPMAARRGYASLRQGAVVAIFVSKLTTCDKGASQGVDDGQASNFIGRACKQNRSKN